MTLREKTAHTTTTGFFRLTGDDDDDAAVSKAPTNLIAGRRTELWSALRFRRPLAPSTTSRLASLSPLWVLFCAHVQPHYVCVDRSSPPSQSGYSGSLYGADTSPTIGIPTFAAARSTFRYPPPGHQTRRGARGSIVPCMPSSGRGRAREHQLEYQKTNEDRERGRDFHLTTQLGGWWRIRRRGDKARENVLLLPVYISDFSTGMTFSGKSLQRNIAANPNTHFHTWECMFHLLL